MELFRLKACADKRRFRNLRLEKISATNDGSVLITVVAMIFIITAYILYTWVSVRRLAQKTAVQSQSVSALSIAENHVIDYLRIIESYQYPLDARFKLPPQGIEIIRDGYAPLVTLAATGEYLGVERNRSLLLSMRHLSQSVPQLPNWGAFKELLEGGGDGCLMWSRDIKEQAGRSSFRSLRTCRSFRNPLADSFFLSGNLVMDRSLKIRNFHDRVIYLVIVGDIDLKKGLRIENSSNLVVELVSAGDMRVDSIETVGINDVTVLLHSSAGMVEINNIADKVISCSEERGPLSIAVEAREGIKLRRQPLRKRHYFEGCFYPRFSPLWKKFKIVGEVL